jgi:hypothetical protein
MGKRLEDFLSRAGLIRGVNSNCSGVREKRPGCVKKLPNRIKPNLSGGVRIESSETSQRRRDHRSHLPNFWSCRPLRQWELPVAGSHWPSGTTDLDGHLTENSEEPLVIHLFGKRCRPSSGFRCVSNKLGVPRIKKPDLPTSLF